MSDLLYLAFNFFYFIKNKNYFFLKKQFTTKCENQYFGEEEALIKTIRASRAICKTFTTLYYLEFKV